VNVLTTSAAIKPVTAIPPMAPNLCAVKGIIVGTCLSQRECCEMLQIDFSRYCRVQPGLRCIEFRAGENGLGTAAERFSASSQYPTARK
jgi:hypothetical protein